MIVFISFGTVVIYTTLIDILSHFDYIKMDVYKMNRSTLHRY